MENKLTDNEIVKALEYCSQQGSMSECERCKIKRGCRFELIKLAFDLINRLQAKLDEAEDTIQFADKELKKAEAEVERLKYCNETNISSIATLHEQLKTTKAEAYKEFAENLKERTSNKFWGGNKMHELKVPFVGVDDIDNLLKELVGDANESKI